MDPSYDPSLPRERRPIVLIGAGGIVRDAHLPAYRKAGFPVASIYDRPVARDRAAALAREYGIPAVHDDLDETVRAAPDDCIFDLALMPAQFLDTLAALPDEATVLIQKPMGNTLAEAQAIVRLCRRKRLRAAVNMQLRFAPYIAAARKMIAAGRIGELYDFEVRVTVATPWERFPNVTGQPRLEINNHSIHYLDLARSFLGDPERVSAVTVGHPAKKLANTRSVIVLRYGDRPVRAVISTNHDHTLGPQHEESFVKWEGTHGALRATMGLLLNYPDGGPDALEYKYASAPSHEPWQRIPFDGSWFPDAFVGSMGVLMRYLEGSIDRLPTSVADVYRTMAVVEAAYESDCTGGCQPRYEGPFDDH